MVSFNGNIKLIVAAAVPLIVAAVGYGTVRAKTEYNDARIAIVERELQERSSSIEASAAARQLQLQIDRLQNQIDRLEVQLLALQRRVR